jgi:hypothetical protein
MLGLLLNLKPTIDRDFSTLRFVEIQARHIPAGMENFTVTDDRGWQTIKSVIDRSDYYVLILAGRYGSVDSDGQSWTEKEYQYATSKGIPVLPRSYEELKPAL